MANDVHAKRDIQPIADDFDAFLQHMYKSA